MKRKLSGNTHSEVTRFKEAWRTKLESGDKDFFFSLFNQAGNTTAKIRDLIRNRWGITLEYDSQMSGDGALFEWCWQERLADLEAERQEAEEREEQEAHPDWTKAQLREALLRKMYRRAERLGEWKLGLAAIKQDAALEAGELDRAKFQQATAELVLQHAHDEVVQKIAASPMDHTAQLQAVGKHLFGDLWT